MTIEISDTVWYDGTMYSLLRVRGEQFFDPAEYGLVPEMLIPSAERGYWCDYGIKDGQLLLEMLNIHTQGNVYPLLNGRSAETGGDSAYEEHRQYRNTALPVAFSGQMILVRDPDLAFFRPGSGMESWGYRTVLELTFAEGILVRAEDRSGISAAVRTAITQAECGADAYDFVKTLPASASDDGWWLL